tara:strand:- start:3923 stop:4768 length:846 start_codon:yes stop_codon:yes gene_type:complete
MDNNVLAVAQREYMDQMNDVLLPFLITNFDEIYDRAKVDSKGKNTLILFQQYLKDIKSWNQGILRERTEEVSNSCAYFSDLLAAIIVGYVKILSSVRLKMDKQKLAIKLPKSDDFIFRIYEEVAKILYKSPYWVGEELSEDDKIDNMRPIVARCMEQVVKSLIPVQTILEAYIGQRGKLDVESQVDPNEDPEDPDMLDDVPDALDQDNNEQPKIDIAKAVDDVVNGTDTHEGEGEGGGESEIKEVPITNPPPEMIDDIARPADETGDGSDDDLFPDLRDKK